MATSNYRENTSQDYTTPTYTDNSSLCDGLLASSSMQATNTVSEVPGWRGPGRESEASAGIAVGDVNDPNGDPLYNVRPLIDRNGGDA